MQDKKEKLILIDSNALVHRAYHALPPLSSQSGELTNAVYGFTSLLIKAINDLNPDYIVATFDLPEPTFRHKEFDEYKAHRVKTPDDLIPQFEKVKNVLRAFNIPVFEKAGFEADDLIGTISKMVKDSDLPAGRQASNVKCIIITGDLDTLQLVDENTEVMTLKKGISETVLYDEMAVRARYGLEPEQMADFKGLKGDPSDNIPGVPGIGDKTASSLLQEYKTLENIYENIGLIPKKLSGKLSEFKDQAFFSKKLATIKRDVDIDFKIEDAKFGEYDKEKVKNIFRELNFFSLISRLNLNKNNFDKKPEHLPAKTAVLGDFSSFRILENEVLFYSDKGLKRLSFEKAKEIFEDEKIKKAGYDIKESVKILKEKNIVLKGECFDIKIASYLLSSGAGSYGLEKVMLDELGEEYDEKDEEKSVYLILAVREKLEEKLQRFRLLDLFKKMEMPMVFILADMETAGVKVNREKLEKFSEGLSKILKEKEKNIYNLAGREFNINSPTQLGPVLFDELQIQKDLKVKKTKTGAYSTNEQELEKFKQNHEIVKEVLEYREFAKLKNTYSDALPLLIDKKTGRIHTTYNHTGTATGRISSSNPNLQNIPQKGEFAKYIREAFVAEDGYSLLAFDYSQIELRIVASLSGDKKMMEIFNAGGDIHTATAMEINNVSINEVTPEMRRVAKVLNFGILFGMSVKGVSDAAEIDMHSAKKFMEEYFSDFSGVAKFIEETVRDAKRNGYVKTLTGRTRWLPDLKSPNWLLKQQAERMAQNMPVQGLEADILKMAMIKIDEEILKEDKISVRMILQVHDELVFEAKDDIINDVKDKIKYAMENAYKLNVPLVAEIKIGKNWSDMKKEL